MAVHQASTAYRGQGKTDEKDAFVIADQARMRKDLGQLRPGDEIAVDLRTLTTRRTDLVNDRTRQINRLPDLVDRDFVASAPNRTCGADFTHAGAWNGTVYVAFIVDTFSRRIVNWSAATTKHTELVLAALEMALWQRDSSGTPPQRGQLIHHSDAGNTPRSRWPSTWTATA